jgi:hypothetical protein
MIFFLLTFLTVFIIMGAYGGLRIQLFANKLVFLVLVMHLDWLDMDLILPFKIGDFAEARSFVPGFNGAWFRSKVGQQIYFSMCMF